MLDPVLSDMLVCRPVKIGIEPPGVDGNPNDTSKRHMYLFHLGVKIALGLPAQTPMADHMER